MTSSHTSLPDVTSLPLPEMRQAVLSHDEMRALLADLQAHATVWNTQCKTKPSHPTPPHDLPLEHAVELLFAGNVQAIQIRYQFDQSEWTDTLFNNPLGIRLVRIQHLSRENRSSV